MVRLARSASVACAALLAATPGFAQEGGVDLLTCTFEPPALCLGVVDGDAGHLGDEACDEGASSMTVTFWRQAMHSGQAELQFEGGARWIVSAGAPDRDLYFTFADDDYVLESPHTDDMADGPAPSLLLARRGGEPLLIDARRGSCTMDAASEEDAEARFGVTP